MSAALEAIIIDKLHRLSEQRLAAVLDFVEYLASKPSPAPPPLAAGQTADRLTPLPRPQPFDPMRYSGTVPWPVDGLAYQDAIRQEWE
jgi:hypothetical protein